MANNNSKEQVIFSVLQYLGDAGLKETIHTIERESSLYFDKEYFEDMILKGMWDEAEKYLTGFTKVEDNGHSTKIFFELRKQKYLEALDSNDRAKASNILMTDLIVFRSKSEALFKDLTHLLTIENIRDHPLLSTYQDANWGRKNVIDEIKKIMEKNPMLDGKLKFPAIESQRLMRLLSERIKRRVVRRSQKGELMVGG
ncbi:transducin family protein/WD-40 repeat protein [Medicago truncatula]|uniref:Transducin family protein/WD-40 repeat protein n=1 Tax=Medicago truncatula TaxID=3880 RepID=G7I3K6_MEDTR|nr:transducin family protein/WD-40 repeat protein [Medicago truncatula]